MNFIIRHSKKNALTHERMTLYEKTQAGHQNNTRTTFYVIATNQFKSFLKLETEFVFSTFTG